jgi:hypothetical protein
MRGIFKRKDLADIHREHELLMLEVEILKREMRSMQRKLDEKEVRHTQVVKVEVDRKSDFDWDIGY